MTEERKETEWEKMQTVRVGERKKDAVEDILDQESKELSQEYNRLRLEELVAKKKKSLEDVKKNLGSGYEVANQGLSVEEAARIAELPPERQQAVLMVMQAFKSQGGRQDTASQLLPLLIMNQMGSSQQQMTPQALLSLMIEFQNATKNAQPQERSDLLQKMSDQMLGLMKEQLAEAKSQTTSPIETLKTWGEVGKILGYKAPGEGGEGNTQVEMARVEMQERENIRNWEYKMDQSKTERTVAIIDNLARAFNPRQIVSDVVEGIVTKQMTPQQQPATQPPTPQPSLQVLQYKCECGATFAAPADQTSAVCVACGREYPDLAQAAAKARREVGQQPSNQPAKNQPKEEKKNGDGGSNGDSSDEGANIRV